MDGHELWLEQCAKLGISFPARRYQEGTRTSEDAALQLGCDVAHIAKSIVFEGRESPVIVITSGANRVDRKRKLERLLGYRPSMAQAKYVEQQTGYAPGGVPPFGHLLPCTMVMDEDLFRYETVWGAAGCAETVFSITPSELQRMTRALVGDVKQ